MIQGKTYHLFGDSHLGLYVARQGVSTYYRPGATMHRIGRDGLTSLTEGLIAGGLNNVPNGDIVGLIFGEIDVRVHVGRQRDEFGRDPEEVLDTLVEAFGVTVEKVRELRPASRILLFSPVPPAGTEYPGFDPAFPRNGSDEERVSWYRGLSVRLNTLSISEGYCYVDQYTPFSRSDGMLDLECSDDGVHIRQSLCGRIDLPI